jgi:hypothetical protein
MKNQYKDLFGKEIKVGDFITYAANDGRCGVLRVGQVTKLTEAKNDYEDDIQLKIRVKSARYGYLDWDEENENIYGWTRQKDVTLGFLDRLIVVDNLPEEVRNVLKD